MTKTLTDDQQRAISKFQSFLLNKDETFFIINGDAGTGKTYLISKLVEMYNKNSKFLNLLSKGNMPKLNIQLTATTNKAANVLQETVHLSAKTIHSFLGLKVKIDYRTGKQTLTAKQNLRKIVQNTLLFIDESSMISQELFDKIKIATVNTVNNANKIVLIGDSNQLPPIGCTHTITQTLKYSKVNLTQIVRNTGNITKTSQQFKKALRTAQFTPINPDGVDIKKVDNNQFKKLIAKEFTKKTFTPNSAKILAWTNEMVIASNKFIRQIKGYDPLLQEGEYAISNTQTLCYNNFSKTVTYTEQLIQITKVHENYTIGNILGRFISINNDQQNYFLPNDQNQVNQYLKLLAKQKKWGKYYNIKDTWLDLRPVYAQTIHKAQGSTYDKVFIPMKDISMCNSSTDVARLCYVAISRASKQVILWDDLDEKYRTGLCQYNEPWI